MKIFEYNESYRIDIKDIHNVISKLADKNDTTPEYVLRDIYGYHIKEAWR